MADGDSTDPRTDAMLQYAGQDTGGPAGDPRTSAMLAAAASQESSPGKSQSLPAYLENPITDVIGGYALRTAGGAAGMVAGGLRGAYDLATGQGAETAAQNIENTEQALAFEPKSNAQATGAAAAQSAWNPINWPALGLSWAGKKLGSEAEGAGASPAVSAALETAPTAAATLFPIVRGASPYRVGAEVPESAEEIGTRQAQASPQSQGAAAAAPRLGQTSPELQQAVVQAAQRTGGAVNPDALARHVEADTLPVPVRLTEGQALQDPVRISTEQNLRGQNPQIAQRFNEQNGQLVQNLQAIRDKVGPDVYSSNAVEHGDTLIRAYQDKAAIADAATDARYQALRDANGGKFPVDPKQLLTNVESALHDNLLYEHAPTELGQLQGLAKSGNMTLEQFEAMRTNLARTMRSSTDGNERAAAGVIREQMENLPLSAPSQTIKALADQARASARAQFQMVEADPAYKAAISGDVPPDRFVQKFVTGGTRDNVALMRQNLSDNPVAQQTIGVATVDHLRHAAGIDDMGNGNFSQANFNKQMQALGPKMDSLLDPRATETLEQLGNVARYTQAQPRGAFVNNSNTLVGALAEHGAGMLEAAANAKTGGFGGSLVRGMLNKRATGAVVRRALAPGAGLDVLSTQ